MSKINITALGGLDEKRVEEALKEGIKYLESMKKE